MYDFRDKLIQEIEFLKFLIVETQKRIGRKHLGSLTVKTIKKHQYYYEVKRIRNKQKQRYLGTENDERLGEFIMMKVMEAKLPILKNNLKLLQQVTKQLNDCSTDSIINSLGKQYVSGFWGASAIDEMNRLNGHASWEKAEYDQDTLEPTVKSFERDVITCDGMRVRSKGECIIYDLLKSVHIKFEYEKTLYLYNEYSDIIEVHPDFYIECEDGDHIIIEHLGMLGDTKYADTQESKLRMYHLNGYDLGHNLILTSDNSSFGLDSYFISDIIKYVIVPRAKKVA